MRDVGGVAEAAGRVAVECVLLGRFRVIGECEAVVGHLPVLIHPGQTVLQRTRGPWSTAMEPVGPCTNAFEAL